MASTIRYMNGKAVESLPETRLSPLLDFQVLCRYRTHVHVVLDSVTVGLEMTSRSITLPRNCKLPNMRALRKRARELGYYLEKLFYVLAPRLWQPVLKPRHPLQDYNPLNDDHRGNNYYAFQEMLQEKKNKEDEIYKQLFELGDPYPFFFGSSGLYQELSPTLMSRMKIFTE